MHIVPDNKPERKTIKGPGIVSHALEEETRLQWLEDSKVNPGLFELNVQWSCNVEQIHSLMNGVLPVRQLNKIWYVNTLSPSSGMLMKSQGEMRLIDARALGKKEAPKYLTYPAGKIAKPLFLRVTDVEWDLIAKRYGVQRPEPDDERDDRGFWQWVRDSDMPLVVTEGAKKAGLLLSLGYVGISINGVWNGASRTKDGVRKSSEECDRTLLKELAWFLRPGRTVYLCFDSDSAEKKGVRLALKELAQKLVNCNVADVEVKVPTWTYTAVTKGIDDLANSSGFDAVHEAIEAAEVFDDWAEKAFNNGPAWEEAAAEAIIEKNKLVRHNQTFYRRKGLKYVTESNEKVMVLIGNHLKTVVSPDPKNDAGHSSMTNKYLTQVFGTLKATESLHVEDEKFNPPNMINLLNGVLAMHTDGDEFSWTLEPHDSVDAVFTYCCEYDYDPEADREGLDRLVACLDDEVRNTVLDVFSTALDLKDYRAVRGRESRALFFIGTGANGKDALRLAMRATLGPVGVTARGVKDFKKASEGGPSNLVSLFSSRINWSSENSKVKLDSLEELKAAITGDPFTARDLYKPAVEGEANCLIIFNTNSAPALSSDDPAMRGRFAFVEFNKTYSPEPQKGELLADPRMKDLRFVTQNIAPALLNELLQRLKRVMKEKINYGVLDENQRKIREDSNHLLRFVDERVAEAPGEFIFLNELHTELLGWYETEGYANINKDLSSVHPKVDDLRSNLDKKYDPLVSSIVRFKQTLEKLGINLEFRKEKNSNRELRWTLVDKRIR